MGMKFNPFTGGFDFVGGGANTALSNLASVAINTSLISDTDSTDDLGSSAKKWSKIYVDDIVLGDTPTISTESNANLSLVPNGTGYTIIGDAGTTSHTFNTNDDLLVSGRLEVDGGSFFDGAATFYSGGVIFSTTTTFDTNQSINLGTGGSISSLLYDSTNGCILWRLDNTKKNMIIQLKDGIYQNFDHAASSNPTMFIHSSTAPDTNNTQWLSLTHNQTNGVIDVGTGYIQMADSVLMNDNIASTYGTGADASIYYDGTNLVVNPKLVGTGVLSVLGGISTNGNFTQTKASPSNYFINSGTGQYDGAGFYMYANASSFGDYAGVHMASNIMDESATQTNFSIDRVSYTGAYKSSLMQIDINNNSTIFGTTVQSTTITASTGFVPDANDGAYLGTTALQFSDLFLASGAVVNFDNGNATITHSAGVLTIVGDILQAENSSIVLDSALSADGKYSGITEAGTAGAALAFGDLCYLDPTDSRWELADANAASAADGDSRGKLGICVLAAAGNGSATKMLLWGKVRADTAFPTFTINAPIYVSETPGDITETQPTTTDAVIRIIGSANTADELYFHPDNSWITHT